ncbi:TetR/AcrR family transcriptional regulator [Microbacterium oleivorans]|uniref:TetR family transcriptional regulator n=1 Tax=Microbacterium oleivorans TaxID=273677 RepID=A0A7D5EVS7_9MICO|nr:TetR/AcrR family transcriptional regulator [Microbacterium oleivorans]QLD10350.1 TetR family transcriptional regulator [Microbacterium oleivorans]
MSSENRAGRPRVSSRETLAEAACELFLERGYDATTVADITGRAGVSRSSFFNYFASKSAVLWAGLDERIERLESELGAAGVAPDVTAAIAKMGAGFAPDALALAIVNDIAMGVADELARDAAVRAARIGRAVSDALVRSGADRLEADVRGAAWGGAVLAAVAAWARGGAGRSELAVYLERAAELLPRH